MRESLRELRDAGFVIESVRSIDPAESWLTNRLIVTSSYHHWSDIIAVRIVIEATTRRATFTAGEFAMILTLRCSTLDSWGTIGN